MTRKRHGKLRLCANFKTFWFSSVFADSLLLAAAVFQLNIYIHANSVVKDYQNQIAQLTADSEKLEVRLSSENSLQNFDKYMAVQAPNYEKVEVEKIKYVKASDEQLAKR